MINSPWEIKKTSFGESLLLYSSTHMPAVPSLPFSLSPPLTSPGNSSAFMDHFNALQRWVLTRSQVKSLHTGSAGAPVPANISVMGNFVRIFRQITSANENIFPVPSVKEGWVPTPFMTQIKVWGK